MKRVDKGRRAIAPRVAAPPGKRRGSRRPPELAQVGLVATRGAMLLRGGVPADRVLQTIAAEPACPPGLLAASARIELGLDPGVSLAHEATPEWQALGAAWHLAVRTGAPLAPALERIAEAVRALGELRERRDVLLAGPRATVRLVAALPALAVALGALLGFDPLAVLLTPLGALLLTLGAALNTAGIAWARALSLNALARDRIAGLEAELLWIAMGSGAPPEAAQRHVVVTIDAVRADWIRAGALSRSGTVGLALAAARRVGTPLRPILLEEARNARLAAHAEQERDAERLAVRVLVPLGVCVLPAFIAVGVVPVLLSMLGAMG